MVFTEFASMIFSAAEMEIAFSISEKDENGFSQWFKPDISSIRYNAPCSRYDCWDCYLYVKRQFVPGSPFKKHPG